MWRYLCLTSAALALAPPKISLGDYLADRFVGGPNSQMIGSIIASNINLNPPVAAAFSVVPIAFVVIYLLVTRRTGALERM